jgi:uncharacterized protein YndB with AHSA1/START domain
MDGRGHHMNEMPSRVSDESVQKSTGKTWDQWFVILDAEGALEMSHQEIAGLLRDRKYIDNPWWCQTVAVGYEYARGLRILGQTASAGFEIGVQKTLPITVEKAWELLTGRTGRRIWLGDVDEIKLERGEERKTREGSRIEIRSISRGKRIRMTWQPAHWSSPSTLQVSFVPKGKKTSVRFHQEKLVDVKQREEMRRHWQDVLSELEELSMRNE